MVNRHIDPQIREQAVQAILEGLPSEFVAHLLAVSEKSIERWVEKFELYGDANQPVFRPGRPRIIPPELLAELTNRVAELPDDYLDEMKDWLAIYHNIEISRSALSANLLELDLSWKRMRRIARNRDDQERAEWFHQFLREFHPLHLVFLDETSKDGRTLIRKYGRAPRGETPETIEPLERGRRYSVLPAMDINGYFAVRVKEGSFDGEDFLNFVVTDVLPLTEEWPGPRSVLVLDNCATHHSRALREIVEAANRKLIFLPPYSPDFNPIEESFSCLKAYLRRHYRDFQDSETPELDLELACYAAVTPDKVRGWFSHSGYI